MPIRRLTRAAFKSMPWKNGGGEMAEITVFPPGAGLDEFGWRLSMARVAADGPFSNFAGIDRTLTVLDGAGFRLTVDGVEHLLTPASAPLRFAGDVPASAALLAGPVTDLNVMTRRGAFRHEVHRMALEISQYIVISGGFGFLLCMSGCFESLGTDDIISLAADDCLIAEDEAVTLLAREPASAILVSIFPA
jgi:environmental stress-induced protein Ves